MTRDRVIFTNLWVPDGQTQFVRIQRNEHFLLQWRSRLEQIFCFACLAEVDKKRSLDPAEADSTRFFADAESKNVLCRWKWSRGGDVIFQAKSKMPICYYRIAILRSQGGVGVEYFYDLRRRSGCGAKLFVVGADAESKKMRLRPSLLCSRAMLQRSSVPNLHRGRPETLLSLKGQQGTIYWHLIVV